MKIAPTRHAALAFAALASVSACATTSNEYGYDRVDHPSSEGVGTVGGAVAGGAVGALIDHGSGGAILAGTILGGLIGNRIGARIDADDRRRMEDAYYRGLDGPPGEPIEWRSDNGHYGRFVSRDPYDRGGETCRNYDSDVYIDGNRETLTGLACRDQDGRWHDVRDNG